MASRLFCPGSGGAISRSSGIPEPPHEVRVADDADCPEPALAAGAPTTASTVTAVATLKAIQGARNLGRIVKNTVRLSVT